MKTMIMEEGEDPYLDSINPYKLLLYAASSIPNSHYLYAFLLLSSILLYSFFEFHFLNDLITGFRGQSVSLTFDPSSKFYDSVVSKCRILHGRYLATPWLSGPHLQTVFLNFFGNPPVFTYSRQLFHATDGGTLALDWLLSLNVSGDTHHENNVISKDDTTPLVIVIPGLMSDSASPYIKHLAYSTAKRGWHVVVSNHRGLGGISITSDRFYNAGWTEDVRKVIDYLHQEYPKAPLFVVGTSIGANILVKYLGEEGENIPIAGAAAVCSPWDLLIGDRFISRKFQQKFYDRAIAFGLKEYAELHQSFYSRLADWDGITKSRSIRDFDHHATRHVGKYETVDTYYRKCSSASYVRSVSVPLLCISALDDPVCTREAIPWDECRVNENIVLATTQHGGHLAFFEGITASTLWWVRAVDEFFSVLYTSPFMHVQKKNPEQPPSSESSIDHGPFVDIAKDGLVAAINTESISHVEEEDSSVIGPRANDSNHQIEQDCSIPEAKSEIGETSQETDNAEDSIPIPPQEAPSPIKKRLNQLSLQNNKSMLLLAYIAMVTSWPLIGSALKFLNNRRRRGLLAAASLKR